MEEDYRLRLWVPYKHRGSWSQGSNNKGWGHLFPSVSESETCGRAQSTLDPCLGPPKHTVVNFGRDTVGGDRPRVHSNLV